MCSVGQPTEALPFIQLNFKKSLLASVEFAKRVSKTKDFICFASEPYIAYDKVGNKPPGTKVFSEGKAPRAAILFRRDIILTGITKLSNRDCVVAFTVIKGALTVVASIY